MSRRVAASPRRSLPEAVYIELVELVYSTFVPVALDGIALAGVGAVTAARTNDLLIASLAIAGGFVTLGRVALILIHRRSVAARRLDFAAAQSWERRYAGGSFLMAALVGALGAAAFGVNDPSAHMLATGLLLLHGSGLIARASLRPWICNVSLGLGLIPAIGMIFTHAEAAYYGHGLLLAMFLVASLETVRFRYRTTVDRLIATSRLAAG